MTAPISNKDVPIINVFRKENFLSDSVPKKKKDMSISIKNTNTNARSILPPPQVREPKLVKVSLSL